MMTATNTRQEARNHLQNKWGKGAIITLCYFVFVFILGFISGIFEESSILSSIISIAEAIIEIPISFGLIISFIKLKRDENVGAFDFLRDGFATFKRAWGIALRMIVKMIVPIILEVIAMVILIASSFSVLITGLAGNASALQSASGGTLLGFILVIVAGIYAYVVSLRYVLSYFIAYDNPELSCKEAVEKSNEMMKNNKGNYFVLTLSFIGWAILAAIPMGIGYLWLIPYMMVSQICFYEELKGNQNF